MQEQQHDVHGHHHGLLVGGCWLLYSLPRDRKFPGHQTGFYGCGRAFRSGLEQMLGRGKRNTYTEIWGVRRMSTNKRALQTRPTHHHAVIAKATRVGSRATGICLLTLLLAGCGSSNSSKTSSGATATSSSIATSSSSSSAPTPSGPLPAGVVAQVGDTQITEPVLAQWMLETVAGDFYAISSHLAPPHLVAEPANYPACVTELKKLTPIPGEGPPQHQPTPAQLLKRCRELYETVKKQALGYLVNSYWSKAYDANHGIQITPTETEQGLKRVHTEQYSKPGAYTQMLTNTGRSPSQEQFIIENELLNQKVTAKLIDEGEKAATAFNKEATHTANNANCRPTDIVAHCKGYKPPKEEFSHTNKGAPDLLLEEIARWRPETSHGFTGQPITF
jgi:hypothetical protein